ncbi:hypothetical protein BH18GEM1_BH18GEM1_02490 [soil metagenome]
MVVLVAGGVSAASVAKAHSGDERAVAIAQRALDAVENGWRLGQYDAARRVRAAVNLRGGGAGLTANVVADRAGRRYRVDAAGDIGPLTLYANAEQAALHVPGLGQYARRSAGPLAPGATLSRSLRAEFAAMRARLDQGYGELVYRGDETLDGAAVHRIDDSPAPGVTASYWIDAGSYLPRRIVLVRPGRQNLQVDFRYGGGPRPNRVDAYLRGQHDVRLAITPRYDESGRMAQLHAVSRVAGGGEFTTDVNLDWSPSVGVGYFSFTPPAGAQEVPFEQLASGVVFAAAGKLGALLPLFTGWL